jgi:hypothetical protein
VPTPQGLGGIVDHFVDCIRHRRRPWSSIEQAAHVTEAIVRAYESSARGGIAVPLITRFERVPSFRGSSSISRSPRPFRPRCPMLSTDEIHQFERDGFVGPFTIPPDVFAEFGEAFQSRVAHVLLGEQRSKMSTFIFRNQHVHSRSVYSLITIDPILSRVQSLLGPTCSRGPRTSSPETTGTMGSAGIRTRSTSSSAAFTCRSRSPT